MSRDLDLLAPPPPADPTSGHIDRRRPQSSNSTTGQPKGLIHRSVRRPVRPRISPAQRRYSGPMANGELRLRAIHRKGPGARGARDLDHSSSRTHAPRGIRSRELDLARRTSWGGNSTGGGGGGGGGGRVCVIQAKCRNSMPQHGAGLRLLPLQFRCVGKVHWA